MLKKVIKTLVGISLIAVAISLGVGESDYEMRSDIEQETIERLHKLNLPQLGLNTFLAPGYVQYIIGLELAKKGKAGFNPFIGFVPQKGKLDETIDILLESPGGSVGIMYSAINYVARLKKQGVKLRCYVAEAQSAAFTFMITSCHKVIVIKGAKISQHRAFYSGAEKQIENVGSRITTLQMNKLEADALKLPPNVWYAITRKSDLKTFDYEELKKYGIADSEFE
jgi:ATP-dependent protease ClpP protease subunit